MKKSCFEKQNIFLESRKTHPGPIVPSAANGAPLTGLFKSDKEIGFSRNGSKNEIHIFWKEEAFEANQNNAKILDSTPGPSHQVSVHNFLFWQGPN